MAQWYKISCTGCGYKTDLVMGSSVTTESLKDLNEDSADFRIFACANDQELLSLDVHSSDFNNTCPVCGRGLEELTIEKIPVHACPKCSKTGLQVTPFVHL